MYHVGKSTRLPKGVGPVGRLNTHGSHKLESIDPRKRSPQSPDGNNPGPPSPSEVLVFNNTNHGGGSGGNRSAHNTVRSLPEVPQVEETYTYFKTCYLQKMREAGEHKWNVHFIKDEERGNNFRRENSVSHTPGSSQPPTPKQKNSPQHHGHRK